MALVMTHVPGNKVRVACTFCSEGLTLSGFSMSDLRPALEVVEQEHRCASAA